MATHSTGRDHTGRGPCTPWAPTPSGYHQDRPAGENNLVRRGFKTFEISTKRKARHMPRAKKICAKPGCPRPATGSLCTPHARAADKARGTREQRGYGQAHRNQRQAIAPQVATGTVRCARCNDYIQPGQDWHLDHDDNDRTKYIGPSHKHCNLSAAGRAAHRYDPR